MVKGTRQAVLIDILAHASLVDGILRLWIFEKFRRRHLLAKVLLGPRWDILAHDLIGPIRPVAVLWAGLANLKIIVAAFDLAVRRSNFVHLVGIAISRFFVGR